MESIRNKTTIFEINEQFPLLVLSIATSHKEWAHIRKDLEAKVRRTEAVIEQLEHDQEKGWEKELRKLENTDSSDPIVNLFLQYRKFLKITLEIWNMAGIDIDLVDDAWKDEFRLGLSLYKSGIFSSFFRINKDAERIVSTVIGDINADGSGAIPTQFLSTIEGWINKLSVVRSPDTDRPKLYQYFEAIKSMTDSSEKTRLMNLVKKKLSETDFSVFNGA